MTTCLFLTERNATVKQIFLKLKLIKKIKNLQILKLIGTIDLDLEVKMVKCIKITIKSDFLSSLFTEENIYK